MGSDYFVEREVCPICRTDKRTSLYSCGFHQSPIKEFLEGLYSPQGKSKFEYLDGIEFILDE